MRLHFFWEFTFFFQIPNAYYAGNLAGYSGFSGYTSPYFSYQSRYPSQQSQVRTYSTSTTSSSNKNTYSHGNKRTYLYRTYPIFQYNTRSIYQQPKPQYNYNTVAKNDPYAANPHVTKLRPAYNSHYKYVLTYFPKIWQEFWCWFEKLHSYFIKVNKR